MKAFNLIKIRAVAIICCFFLAGHTFAATSSPAAPLAIGETFSIDSIAVKETRRINVYLPAGCAGKPLPVMYMPDGGMREDFRTSPACCRLVRATARCDHLSWSGLRTLNAGAIDGPHRRC